jgi:asparagine synthase (glutamine-hydrolysing)
MCGICGLVHLDGRAAGEGPVAGMVGRLKHRGPDDAGVNRLGGAAFGATRLEIRNGVSGSQPMVDLSRGLIVACNGEIDNHDELREWLRARGHEFSDDSDVSVIPALYAECGPDMVGKLEGPFALAVWDAHAKRLLLARDRVGERPLYFEHRDAKVTFATELSALLPALPEFTNLDMPSIHAYLRAGWFEAPNSPFANVRKLAPAEVLLFEQDSVTRHRTWSWPLLTSVKQKPDADAFDNIFREAVRCQTDIDGKFGVFLSGGLDSGLVAAVARDLYPDRQIPSYTLRFSETSFDEGESARAIAEQLKLSPQEVWVEPSHLPQLLSELVRITGEPLGDPAWIPTALLARRAAEEVAVVLVGEGGDEVFGGYPTYLGPGVASVFGRIPSPVRAAIAGIVHHWPISDQKVTISFLLKRFIEGWDLDPVTRHYQWTSVIAPPLLERLGVKVPPHGHNVEFSHALDALQTIDLESSMAEGLLTKVDRAAMHAALEPRAPFLDLGVLEFAATLPVGQRVSGWTTKRFLKEYARRYLPDSTIFQKKRGLSVPVSAWLREPLEEWARVRLTGDGLKTMGVNTNEAKALLEEHLLRHADHGRAIWLLLTLAEWAEWRLESTNPTSITASGQA